MQSSALALKEAPAMALPALVLVHAWTDPAST
jgi:hypothetical protein